MMMRKLLYQQICRRPSDCSRMTLTCGRLLSTTSELLSKNTRVGFIGLGNMGLPMALNIQAKSKMPVLVHDINKDACDSARSQGLYVSDSIHGMIETILSTGRNSDTSANTHTTSAIVTMVPSCAILDNIMNELIQHIPNESGNDNDRNKFVLIDCSTVHPSTSRKWNRAWGDHGHYFLDAPVSGGVAGARAATLTFMVGASNDDIGFQRAEPYLTHMGQRIIACGGPGAGSVAKLCNNLALAAQMVGICEALVLGDTLGVDPVVLADVMNVSTAKCWSNEVNNPHKDVSIAKGSQSPASRHYEGGFSTKLLLKDLTLALDAASDCGASLPVTTLTRELYRTLNEDGLGDKDFGVMFQYLQNQIKEKE